MRTFFFENYQISIELYSQVNLYVFSVSCSFLNRNAVALFIALAASGWLTLFWLISFSFTLFLLFPSSVFFSGGSSYIYFVYLYLFAFFHTSFQPVSFPSIVLTSIFPFYRLLFYIYFIFFSLLYMPRTVLFAWNFICNFMLCDCNI
jgi:hypothetical protein